MKIVVNILAVTLSCAIIAVASDAFRTLGLSLYTEQYLAALLAIALPLLFLHVPAGKGAEEGVRSRVGPVPWYDIAAAVVSSSAAAYVAVRFPALSELVVRKPLDGLVTAAVLGLLILEGLRRTTGMALVYTTLFFFGLALMGGSLPGDFAARSIPLDRLTYYVVWDSTASLGVALKIVATIVVIYTIFGHVLFKSGGSVFFTDISMALMGRYRGGPAKIAIVGSSLFGTISGNVVSNVLTVGVVTIPLMKRAGFRPHLAAAIEACASTGGQIMPPVMGVAAFIMAEFLAIPYSEVAIAALIPALLYYIAVFFQVDLEAGKTGMKGLHPGELPRMRTVLAKGWLFLVPLVVLIYLLFWLFWSAGRSAMGGVFVGLAVAFLQRTSRMNLRGFIKLLEVTGRGLLEIGVITAGAGFIIGVLQLSGLGFRFSLGLATLAGGNVFILLVLVAIACIILGMGMPTAAVYILLAVLAVPGLVELGIDPLAAHLFVFYFGILSMITPPVCLATYAAASIAGSDFMKTALTGMRLATVAYVVPFLFVYSPALLLKGTVLDVVVAVTTAIIGAGFLGIALSGYLFARLNLLQRGLLAVGALGMLTPAGEGILFPLGTDPAGLARGVAGPL